MHAIYANEALTNSPWRSVCRGSRGVVWLELHYFYSLLICCTTNLGFIVPQIDVMEFGLQTAPVLTRGGKRP